jgi:zinc/manganese transport system substrate-binding protein
MRLKLLIALAFAAAVGNTDVSAQTAPVAVVAAENVYGDIAEQIGGDAVKVVSLINNPAQDPHLFEASPATARALAGAQIVIANGADYDAWLDRLLQASPRPDRVVINIATLMGRKPGDNPHLWYDPATMPAFAKALAVALEKADPAHAADYKSRLGSVLASLKSIDDRVAAMRAKYKGQPVTATEPVFGPMLDAIGLVSRNQRFQLAMMNDTEPSAQDLAAFETDLKQRKVKALISNTQVSEALSQRLTAIAKDANVPVVGVTETLPPGKHFQDWVLAELDALDTALSGMK